MNKCYQYAITEFNSLLDTENHSFSNEDVANYEESIENAKKAEYLREKHVGKDAIHVDSYIQNIKIQMNSILKSLKELSIDDLKTKSLLDKVKLISDSFPDISKNYDDMCSLLFKSFEDSVKVFKEDYLHKGDLIKCAQEFSRVSQASKLLKDHLDQNKMKEFYEHMKEYFFEYLTKMGEHEEKSLGKSNLDKESVDSLGEFVSLLESARDNHSLQAHISPEDLNKAYDSFLDKLFNFYERKNESITNDIEKGTSFGRLELSIGQLSLLRTISTIESKTNVSYSMMFEKLYASVNKLKLEVNELLKSILQNDESASYDKLMSNIIVLKNLSWIDKYRIDGFYSDLMSKTIKQIKDHADNLKQTIFAANLELENYSDLKNVNDYIKKMNKLKTLNFKIDNDQFLIPELDLILKEINEWFMVSVNQVLEIVKHLIADNLTKIKECPGFILDHMKIEKAYVYLMSCRDILSLKKSNSAQIFSDLDTMLNSYRDLVKKELNEYFLKVTESSHNTNEDITRHFQFILNRLEEVKKLETKHPRLFDYFISQDEKWKNNEYWQKKILKYHDELSQDMEDLSLNGQKEMLKSKFHILRTFSNLEGEAGVWPDNRFSETYKKYRGIYFTYTLDLSKSLIDSIKNFNFESTASLLAQLKVTSGDNLPQVTQIKQMLNNVFNELVSETQDKSIMLGLNHELSSEEVKMIKANLKKIAEIKCIPIQFFNSEQIDNVIDEIKTTLDQKLNKYLDNVEALIRIHSFHDANVKIELVSSMFHLLGTYCSPDIVLRIDKIKDDEKDIFHNLVKKYNDLDLTSFALNPPVDILKEFDKASRLNPIYSQSANDIRKKILEKFRKELDLAREHQPANTDNNHIRRFESAIKFIPDDMRASLEPELLSCKFYKYIFFASYLKISKKNFEVNLNMPRNTKVG